jgi:hypothetical protein
MRGGRGYPAPVLHCALSALLAAAVELGAPAALPGPTLAGRVLDLALVDGRRVLALTSGELVLLRLGDRGLTPESRLPLPGPLAPVRQPGGMIAPAPGSAWVAASHLASPLLVQLDPRLSVRSRASRLPWSGAPAGLAFVDGTDLVDGAVSGLPPGPHLDLAPGLALSAVGRLLTANGPALGLRLGPPLSLPWPDVVVASGPAPPSPADELIAVGLLPEPHVLARLPVPGPVRGIVCDVHGERATALVAHGEPAGWLTVPLRRLP